MISRAHPLPLTQQATLLKLSRSSLYYTPRSVSERDLRLMKTIDMLHTAHPFAGARMLRDLLRLDEETVGRRHVSTLMKTMGIEALYRKPNTSKKHPHHKIYPYLLSGLKITRPNQVWATDITYIPLAKGFVYLTVVLDWYSRKVLSWRVSNTMDTSFCLEVLDEALSRYGSPDIFNTDQGSQFTSEAFTTRLKEKGIQISMDGKGSWRDNVFVERLWRSVKYEEVYLKAYDSVTEARRSIGTYLDFYNRRRPHSSLDGVPPDRFYFNSRPLPMAA
jgi:putative transposase